MVSFSAYLNKKHYSPRVLLMTFNSVPQDMMSPLAVWEGIRVWVLGVEEGDVGGFADEMHPAVRMKTTTIMKSTCTRGIETCTGHLLIGSPF
jgi:hypothetical protein